MPMRIGGLPARSRFDVEQLDHLDHFERRAHGRRRRVGQRQRRAEDRHQPVADHLVDHAAVAADGVEHQRVVGVEQLDRLFRRLRLRHRREAADVGEHHRGLDALAAQREARVSQVLGHLARGEAAHQLLLLVAQALLLQAGADARLQQHRVHRLGQVVLGAQLDAAHDAVQPFERPRSRSPAGRAAARSACQLLQHLEAVHLRHLDVEQQQVEGLARAASPARRGRSRRARRV